MSFFIEDLVITKDDDLDLNLKEIKLDACLEVINQKFKTKKSEDTSLTICLRFVTRQNMKRLNLIYSGKNKETNVLSFEPVLQKLDGNENCLGDIAICTDILKGEAKDQNKDFLDHLVHLFVHGVLHLFGYSHDSEHEASNMELIEKEVLKKLSIDDPYQIEL